MALPRVYLEQPFASHKERLKLRSSVEYFLWFKATIEMETNFAFSKWADNYSMMNQANTEAVMASVLNAGGTELLAI